MIAKKKKPRWNENEPSHREKRERKHPKTLKVFSFDPTTLFLRIGLIPVVKGRISCSFSVISDFHLPMPSRRSIFFIFNLNIWFGDHLWKLWPFLFPSQSFSTSLRLRFWGCIYWWCQTSRLYFHWSEWWVLVTTQKISRV